MAKRRFYPHFLWNTELENIDEDHWKAKDLEGKSSKFSLCYSVGHLDMQNNHEFLRTVNVP